MVYEQSAIQNRMLKLLVIPEDAKQPERNTSETMDHIPAFKHEVEITTLYSVPGLRTRLACYASTAKVQTQSRSLNLGGAP